jgi:glycosyltransferase involved in cell wall biosynthesis/putative flippase GtrA
VRIAIVTEVWRPTTNGVVTRLAVTVDHLRSAGHEILIIAPAIGDDTSEPNDNGLYVSAVPTIRLRFVYGGQPWGMPLPRVAKYLAEFEPDVVHVANPAFLGIAGVIAARRQSIPLVCSYHTDLTAYADYYHLGWARPVIRWAQRALYGAATVNMVTSDTARAQLAEAGIEGARMWPRGVDLCRFRPAADYIDDWPRIALYVGRLAEEKGLDALGELTRLANTHLVVVGDGPARARLEQEWSSGSVTFRGVLKGEDLASVYRRSTVFVFPSTTETLGLVLLEALASGLPVVAADSPASREVLTGCRAARLYTPSRPGAVVDAVADLTASAPRGWLAEQARNHVATETWEASTASLTECYEAALSRRGREGPVALPSQVGQFLTVGASNAVIDLGVFNLLDVLHRTTWSATLVLYNTVAVLLALANSYLWNTRWTFRGNAVRIPGRARRRQCLLFGLQAAVNLSVNDIVVAVASAALIAGGFFAPVIAANAAKAAGMLAASAASFALCRILVFRNRPEPQALCARSTASSGQPILAGDASPELARE